VIDSKGYFVPDKDQFKENQERFPTLAALDDRVKSLLKSPKASQWGQARRDFEICKLHPVYWLEMFGHIKAAGIDGDASEVGIIPFKLNPSQLKISNTVCAAFVTRPWGRMQDIELKHRKVGVSTLFAGFDYWLMRFIRGLNAFVIADVGSHTDNIVGMVELFQERDTCGQGLETKYLPPKKVPMSKNKKGLKLLNGSMLEQDSGENSNPGTSGTIQVLHMSENSKWRDPENAETSLLNSVPRTGFVFLIKESTAFGLNKFAKDCEDAEKGKSNWGLTFISWKALPDCCYEIEEGEKVIPSEYEAELMATYKLNLGHIKFRRSQIEMLGSEQRFKQDFPLNSKEPFLVSGANFFNTALVQDRIMEIKFFRDWKEFGNDYVLEKYPEIMERVKHSPRGKREALMHIENRNVLPVRKCVTVNAGRATLVPEPSTGSEDAAVVYKMAEKNKRYLVIIDVAEGIQSDEYTSDNSIIEVIDTWTCEQMLEWGGVYDEEVTALYGVMIAQLYNDATIVIEANNRCGGLLKGELEKTGYTNFFYRQGVSGQKRIKRQFGWETNVKNKKEVCGQLRLDFKNGCCTLHSLALLEEMLYFVDNKGKLGASSGTDDRVMTTSIGLKIIAGTPSYRQPARKEFRKKYLDQPSIDRDTQRTKRQKRKDEILRRFM